ncbi:helicase-related protein [Spirosoma koreense]
MVDEQSITDAGQIDLDYIDQAILDYAGILRKPATINRIMLYEEFLKLSQEVRNLNRLGCQFVVFDNPFYRQVPNQSTHSFVDIEWHIEQNRRFEDDDVFSSFYADCVRLNNKEYVKYLENEATTSSNVTRRSFFAGIDALPNVLPVSQEATPAKTIQFNSSDNIYQDFKWQLFVGESLEQPVQVLVDESSIRTSGEKRELAILNFILMQADVSYQFYVRKAERDTYFRPELLTTLQKHWRTESDPKPSFRTLKIYADPAISNELVEVSQGAVVEQVVRQSEAAQAKRVYEDIFLTSPTGAGKSVLFQVPAMYLAERYELMTIVVAPLKALMYDQVEALSRDRDYHQAAYINSDITLIERQEIIDKIAQKEISVLYLSPELLLSYDIRTFIGGRQLGLFVVDEAHLVTTWGRDFRVDYWFMGNYIRKIRKYYDYRFPVMALTATAVHDGPNDLVYQTISSLNMQNPTKYIGNVKRPEITFSIDRLPITSGNHELIKLDQTARHIEAMVASSTKAIVYFPWVRQIKDVLAKLNPATRTQVAAYYSSVAQNERERTVQGFKTGVIKVVLATKAFGMGVDIADIVEVYHHAPSGNLADYVQEIGRLARQKDLEGVASMDFNERDLKFIKNLFGLSSLKQYQVGLVLKKLWNVYRLKNKRNFLVSVDDFNYIFPNEDDPEQKVKSALLVLEKDFLARFGYNVLIVRPKALFSTVYAKVAGEEAEAFETRFGQFVQRIDRQQGNLPGVIPLAGSVGGYIIPRADEGVCYRIELDRLWEDHLPNESFPMIKQEFFAGTLFPKFGFTSVRPRLQYNLTLEAGWKETFDVLTNRINQLERVLYSLSGFFSKDTLEAKLNAEFADETIAQKAANLLTTLYSERTDFGRNGNTIVTGTNFIQARRNQTTGHDEFRIIDNGLTRVKNATRQKFQTLFGGLPDTAMNLQHYIAADPAKNRETLKLAYMLEMFELATYELLGGELPQIFIRINDPLKIERFATSTYKNSVVEDVHQRHENSVALLDRFFKMDMADDQRWQFIEDYFLGREAEELAAVAD